MFYEAIEPHSSVHAAARLKVYLESGTPRSFNCRASAQIAQNHIRIPATNRASLSFPFIAGQVAVLP
jgi:hypothetical protein